MVKIRIYHFVQEIFYITKVIREGGGNRARTYTTRKLNRKNYQQKNGDK